MNFVDYITYSIKAAIVYTIIALFVIFLMIYVGFKKLENSLKRERFDNKIVDNIVTHKTDFAKRKVNFDKFRTMIPDGDIAEYFYIRDVMSNCGSKHNCTVEVNKTLNSLNYSF